MTLKETLQSIEQKQNKQMELLNRLTDEHEKQYNLIYELYKLTNTKTHKELLGVIQEIKNQLCGIVGPTLLTRIVYMRELYNKIILENVEQQGKINMLKIEYDQKVQSYSQLKNQRDALQVELQNASKQYNDLFFLYNTKINETEKEKDDGKK